MIAGQCLSTRSIREPRMCVKAVTVVAMEVHVRKALTGRVPPALVTHIA